MESSIPWPEIPNLIPQYAQVFMADSKTPNNNAVAANQTSSLKELAMSCQSYQNDNQDLSYEDQEILEEYGKVSLPSVSISDLEFDSKRAEEIVLIFGGEAHGVTPMAKKLTLDSNGTAIHVPLRNTMESLNVACAASVILYQFLNRFK